MRLIITLFIILIFSLTTKSQNYTATILGMENEDTLALEGTIIINATSNNNADYKVLTITNQNGEFVFDETIKRIICMRVGYLKDTITLDLSKRLTFFLKEKNYLKTVEITAEQDAQQREKFKPINSLQLNKNELRRAACCNLSESFDNVPGIDVNYSDGATGVKQIQLLGLTSTYAPITNELVYYSNYLNAQTGLNFVPGAWIKNVQISKGSSTIFNGIESITGAFNFCTKTKCDEVLGVNIYANSFERYEANVGYSIEKNNVSNSLFLHTNSWNGKIDHNKDGFLDNPFGNEYNILNHFKFEKEKWVVNVFLHGFYSNKKSGQYGVHSIHNSNGLEPYRISLFNTRIQAALKVGYFVNDNASLAFITNAIFQEQKNNYGANSFFGNEKTLRNQFIYEKSFSTVLNVLKLGITQYITPMRLGYNNNTIVNLSNYTDLNLSGYNLSHKYINTATYKILENNVSAFFEYSKQLNTKLSITLGGQMGYNSLMKIAPAIRLHARYKINENNQLLGNIGYGQRVNNWLVENQNYYVSNRAFISENNNTLLNQEGYNIDKAWNAGVSFQKSFELNEEVCNWYSDLYTTVFTNRLLANQYTFEKIVVIESQAKMSSSTYFQTELDLPIFKRFTFRTAYRYNLISNGYYNSTTNIAPLQAPHKFFATAGYKLRNKLQFDVTGSYYSSKLYSNATKANLINKSPGYWQLIAQVSKVFLKNKALEVYCGAENILNFTQQDLIISSENTTSSLFDATQIWGPNMPRMFYIGLRYSLKEK